MNCKSETSDGCREGDQLQVIKKLKTNAQKCKEYRERQKIMKGIELRKKNAQKCKEYRERQKSINSTWSKTCAEYKREYRRKMKLKKINASLSEDHSDDQGVRLETSDSNIPNGAFQTSPDQKELPLAQSTRAAKVMCIQYLSNIISEERSRSNAVRERSRLRLANESAEQRQQRLEDMRRRSSQRLANESKEQRERRLADLRRRASQRVAAESIEQRQRRLEDLRRRQSRRLANESNERREQLLEQQRRRDKEKSVRQNLVARVTRGCENISMKVKMERDNDTVTTSRQSVDHMYLQKDFAVDGALLVKQGCDNASLKVKMECDDDDDDAATTSRQGVEHVYRQEDFAIDGALLVKQESDETPVMVKTNYDDDAVTSEVPVPEHLWKASGWTVKEEDDFVVKTEHDADELVIKQELDIAPTVLQPQSALPAAPTLLPVEAYLGPVSSSVDSIARPHLYTLPTKPKADDVYAEGGSGVSADSSFVLDVTTADVSLQRVLKEHCYGLDGEGLPSSTQHGGQCRCHTASLTECDCSTNSLRTKADTQINVEKCDSIKKIRTCENPHKSVYDDDVIGLPLLNIPVRTSADKKLYKCEECNYHTFHRVRLKIHRHAHTAEKYREYMSHRRSHKKPLMHYECERVTSPTNFPKKPLRTYERRNRTNVTSAMRGTSDSLF